jgi:hypothetical protein
VGFDFESANQGIFRFVLRRQESSNLRKTSSLPQDNWCQATGCDLTKANYSFAITVND